MLVLSCASSPTTLPSMASTLKPYTPPSPSSKNSSSSSPPSSTLELSHHLSRLSLCTTTTDLHHTLPPIVKLGLLPSHPIQTKLLSLLARFGDLPAATQLLHTIPDKDDELYHSLLKAHCTHSPLSSSLAFLTSMNLSNIPPVVYNFTYLLKSCADHSDLRRGREIHSLLISHGFSSNVFAVTAVLNMYAKCRRMDDALKMFHGIGDRDLVAWNAMVSGYSQNGLPERAIEMVALLQEDGKVPDSITLVSVMPACANVRALSTGRSIHAFCVRAGFEPLVNIGTALVDMYAKCGAIGRARVVFDRMRVRNVVSWNSMIDGYVGSGDAAEAMRLFKRMVAGGVAATDVSVMAALHACAELGDVEEGKIVHEFLTRIGLENDVSVTNSLITMYSKCKRADLAAEVFEELRNKSLVSWNAMISGYTLNGRTKDALSLFSKMQQENVKPDSFTMVSVIPALADMSVLRHAKWIHGLTIRLWCERNIFVMAALVDMYAKCGSVRTARFLFNTMDERDVTTWNAMIDGYGSHGLGKDAIELFEEMRRSPVKPNDVTFLCVLSACSHCGLANEGQEYFASMKHDYGFEPCMEHYGTMVDLLGRAGRLEEAWEFIQRMPIEPGITVYGAMLGACKIHKNVQLGEMAASRLFELEPDVGGYHVLLANIYATASMWEDVARVRTMMDKKGLHKTPGCSSIDLRSEVHTFYSGSTNHPQSKKVYARLDVLVDEIKAIGYVPDTESTLDVDDDVKEQLLNTHSEKLAIAFGLINTAPGTTIQIRKNLRVCTDCHKATKFISQVTGREIIVRDMQRFHHFKNGQCSCGDYW